MRPEWSHQFTLTIDGQWRLREWPRRQCHVSSGRRRVAERARVRLGHDAELQLGIRRQVRDCSKCA